MKKQKNPLSHRIPRELKEEAGKYLVIFLLLTFTIGLISGFLVADNSMIIAYNESFEKYNIEHGHFNTEKELNKAVRGEIEDWGIILDDQYYKTAELTNDSTLRLYQKRSAMNLECLMKGSFPQKAGEIAIDRMYADNNDLSVGDTITDGTFTWTITGLVALSDYSCLFESNSDTMFDALQFGVAVLTDEGYEAYPDTNETYSYAWQYKDGIPEEELDEKELSDDFLTFLNTETNLKVYVPRYQNQAINFTGEDMGSDKQMMVVLLYIIIVIMAFVFAITISDTIQKEAAVIGTLRALGYTKRELVRHYMTLPVLVTLVSALVGNILGYTFMKNVCAAMYYGSYSLPTYVTVWNAEAFWLTTVVPIVLMAVINYAILRHTLRLEPLKFLRRDLSRAKSKNPLRLSIHIPFLSRFRIRVLLQNGVNYLVMFIGIYFASILLMFGLAFPDVMENYQETIPDHMLATYQYILNVPVKLQAEQEDHRLEAMIESLLYFDEVETDNEDAEKMMVYSLKTTEELNTRTEDVMLYGIEDDSRYIHLDVSDGQVYISSAFSDKYGLNPGDTFTLKETYKPDSYTFTVAGTYDYDAAICVFMSRELLNKTLDLEEDLFAGYFSDSEITDIDPEYIGSIIDLNAVTKVSRQLMKSMGSMMYLVDVFAVVMYLILIYLLAKIIIEKNTQSISMAKILGYDTREVRRLYVTPTTLVALLSMLISLPLSYELIIVLMRYLLMEEMTGWLTLTIRPRVYIYMIILGFLSYLTVAWIEMRKIRKIPMEEALKNVE